MTYATSRDETRRQLGFMLAVLALAVMNVLVFPNLLSLTVLGASIFLMGSRLVISSKFGWNGPAVSARILVDARLADLVKVLRLYPERFVLDSGDRRTLTTASSVVLTRAQRATSTAGHVYRKPPTRTTVTLIAVLSAIAGVVLGILVLPALSPYFAPLCGFSTRQWKYFLGGLVLISVIFGGIPLAINLIKLAWLRRSWRKQPMEAVENTVYLWRTGYPETAAALDGELERVAEVCRSNPADATRLMEQLGVSRRSLEGRPGWYERLALTPGAELMLDQMLFVMGIFATLLLSPMFGVGC